MARATVTGIFKTDRKYVGRLDKTDLIRTKRPALERNLFFHGANLDRILSNIGSPNLIDLGFPQAGTPNTRLEGKLFDTEKGMPNDPLDSYPYQS